MADRRNTPRTICPAFWFGDVVYLKVDEEGEAAMVTKISIMPNDSYLFTVSWANGTDTAHYDFELEAVSDVVPVGE